MTMAGILLLRGTSLLAEGFPDKEIAPFRTSYKLNKLILGASARAGRPSTANPSTTPSFFSTMVPSTCSISDSTEPDIRQEWHKVH